MRKPIVRWVLWLLMAAFLAQVGVESFHLGFASGAWIGRYSLKWAVFLAGYSLFALGLLFLVYMLMFQTAKLKPILKNLEAFRSMPSPWYEMVGFIEMALPAFLIFFTPFGSLYTGWAARFLVFGLPLMAFTDWLAAPARGRNRSQALLMALLLMGSTLVLAQSFSLVSNSPFSLHWSEGNRIWDYSVMFGADRYNVPAGQQIFTFIDAGRQALWGLPFALGDVPIWLVRFWSAVLVTIPYALLGWFVFKPIENKRGQWIFLGLWTMLFLSQGPIYTPLILSAMLIAALRRRPILIALPLAYLAGHYAGSSRFTWRFAPALWAGMLTLGDAYHDRGKLSWRVWLRGASLGLAAIWSKGLPILVGIWEGLQQRLAAPVPTVLPSVTQAATSATESVTVVATATPKPNISVENLEGLVNSVTDQAFLWYRLLPNEVYRIGILVGLALATLPLIFLLVRALRQRDWLAGKILPWLYLLASLAFLVVGLLASTKVGGGADLHNLDMFLVTLVLLAGLAWQGGLGVKFDDLLLDRRSAYQGLLVLMLFFPTLLPVLNGRPPEKVSGQAAAIELQRIEERVMCAAQYGDVLFMDQRQLLTFGHMGDLPLIDEYEKKYVMNQALSGNEGYFEQFREDLASGRFVMIVTERQALRFKLLGEDQLGDSLVEENNAWVQWVTMPLLEYYESIVNRKDIGIEIFVPIERDFDC